MMGKATTTGVCLLLLIIVTLIVTLIAPVVGQYDFLEGDGSNRMALSVYVDEAGRSLVTGYAENISGLGFLRSSHYRYINETGQLYALTDSLTSKHGDNWTLSFSSEGDYDECHAKFFLPEGIRLRKIICSAGMEYIVYTSNNSFVAEAVGYDLQDPSAVLEYQMPLEGTSKSSASASTSFSHMFIAVLAVLGILGLAVGSKRKRILRFFKTDSIDRSVEPDLHADAPVHETSMHGEAQIEKAGASFVSSTDVDHHEECSPQTEVAGASIEVLQILKARPDVDLIQSLAVTPEMAAIMVTLTERERGVIDALLRHGGRMTQAEVRRETETPGSTLTGILASLERRKLVTKKECGRTNVIDLSEWFLSRKED